MFFRRFFLFALVGLLLFGLLGSRARTEYAEGYAQGYAAGLQVGAGSAAPETAPAPPARPAEDGPGWGWGWIPLAGLFGLLLPFGLLILGFGLVFGRVRRRAFRRAWGHDRRGHASAACGPWGQGHHWRGPGVGREKRPEDVEPEIHHA